MYPNRETLRRVASSFAAQEELADEGAETEVDHGQYGADGDGDDEHEAGQVEDLPARQPGDLLQLADGIAKEVELGRSRGGGGFTLSHPLHLERGGTDRVGTAFAFFLSRLPVGGVVLAPGAVLRELQAPGVVLLVLVRSIGPLVALVARESDD